MEVEENMEIDEILDMDLGSVQRKESNILPRFALSVLS